MLSLVVYLVKKEKKWVEKIDSHIGESSLKANNVGSHIGEVTLKIGLCSSCFKYLYNCPYDSKGEGVVSCDRYRRVVQRVGVSTLSPKIGRAIRNGKSCPNCDSINIRGAYGDRMECKDCGKIFT